MAETRAPTDDHDVAELAARVRAGDRRALARAITLIESRRADQAREWLWREVREQLIADLADDPDLGTAIAGLEADVVAGRIPPTDAARQLLDQHRARRAG